MTAIKVDAKPSTHAAEALAPHAAAMFARLGSTRMAVVELRAVERELQERLGGQVHLG